MHLRLFFSAVMALLLCVTCRQPSLSAPESPSEAGESLRLWAMARMFPNGLFYTEKYTTALTQMRLEASIHAQDRGNSWEAIGPKNIGGRTLCLAINPLDTNILYAGSAAGGIWKSTTAGRGAQAWTRIETGFPVLGVSAIAIDPQNPNVLYAGTGEVYNVEFSMPNVAFRTTRGTYGIGILKSTDGGQSWSKSLDWSYGDLRGVQDIKINPLRPATVYAATTEGLLRSYNAGATWQTVHNRKMAVDIEINPADTSMVFVTHGSLDDQAVSGIFRSTDGGNSFQLLNNGIAISYSGKAMLGICPGQPNTIYASVGNAFVQEGLYRSNDSGASWTKVNAQDVCTYQGWYSHDVAVHPSDPNTIIWVGVDTWKSINGGNTAAKKTFWYTWVFGQVPAGGPEGPPYYVHGDIHRTYWLQSDPKKLYSVTDGGIFVSYDSGETWQGRNGGYQTQQFYANMGNSTTDPALCIGGMQDNATAIYTGTGDWTRVLGGDGQCAGINPQDDRIMFGSSQYLNMSKSVDGGASFYNIVSSEMANESPVFNGPFVIAPSDPQVMYAGAQSLYRSDDTGDSWANISGGAAAGGDPILTIAVDPQNANRVFFSTVPVSGAQARVFKFDATTGLSTLLTGLPNRFCMDIAIDPTHSNIAYTVFSGFNAGHVWKTVDGGVSWTNIDNGLPDIPTNTVLIDPLDPDRVYIGNDVGVWLSRDAGTTWELFSAGAPNALPVMDLSATSDRKLRVATHGLGVWQAPMAELVGVSDPLPAGQLALHLFPNPATDRVSVQFDLPAGGRVHVQVVDARGRVVLKTRTTWLPAGEHLETLDCGHWPAGVYGIIIEGNEPEGDSPIRGYRALVKT